MRSGSIKLLLAVLALGLFAERAHGQSVSAPPTVAAACPSVKVSCADAERPDAPLVFNARVSSAAKGLTYLWRVSAGRIARGQGSPSLTLDASEPGFGNFEATVEVGGLPEPCARTASCVTTVISDPVTRCLDEYGDTRNEDEKARLDNFTIELQGNATTTGYILCYDGRVTRAGVARRRCERAKDYLVATRGIPSERVVTLDGGHRENLTVQLCVVPQGFAPPSPSPTVDPRDVKIIRPKPARTRRRARAR